LKPVDFYLEKLTLDPD